MDRTLLNIVSAIVGGAGLFTVLTGFNVPSGMVIEENPFATKRDAIEKWMNWIFVCVALIGLLVQVAAEILGDKIIPPRSHEVKLYAIFTVAMVVAVAVGVHTLKEFGYMLARLEWWPKLIERHRSGFEGAKFIVEHDGWPSEQWEAREGTAPDRADEITANALKEAERRLDQYEELLEISPGGDLRHRVTVLEPVFSLQAAASNVSPPPE